jgi:acyl-CoA dehydrogenase
MAIDLSLDPELDGLRARVEQFVTDVVISLEPRARGERGVEEDLRLELQAAAKAAGIFAPTVATDLGGLGLDWRSTAVVLEAAGYSLIGPLALNAAAPDEGNLHLLASVATVAQRERYLVPLASGAIRSAFAMTEPAPGAGSDPTALQTTARRDGDEWVIDGRKWFITGAEGAGFFICMARTATEGKTVRSTMFFVDPDNPGLEIVRRIGSLDHATPGGHCEVMFDSCRVGADAVLGEPDRGFEYAQVRLNPARLTHCMRWLGVARRARDTALDYVAQRSLFGQRLGDLGMAQQLVADTEIDLAASRALLTQACWALDTSAPADALVPATKVFVSEAVGRVVDRSIQLCGAYGVSDDSPLGWFLREIRPFRIYDGSSETHRWSLARRTLRAHVARSSAGS